jgi:hypothetical protein
VELTGAASAMVSDPNGPTTVRFSGRFSGLFSGGVWAFQDRPLFFHHLHGCSGPTFDPKVVAKEQT